MSLLLVAAEEQPAALQTGYAAYLRGEYDVALRNYERALLQSNEPGRIASELGAIAAEAGRYPEASLWFSRAMEDATGARRAKAAYGQATALIHVAATQPGRRGVAILKQAISLLAIATRETASLSVTEQAAIPSLLEDIQHNQSVAEALLQQKQKEPEPPGKEDDKQDNPVEQNPASSGSGNNSKNAKQVPMNGKSDDPQGNETGTSDSTAGRGNLPPLPDDEKMPLLSRDEAERRLEQLRQRLKQPLTKQPLKPGSKDW